jgi:hypothetical protein
MGLIFGGNARGAPRSFCGKRALPSDALYLIPSENKRDLADVPDAILTAIQWQFYDSPTRAAILALGLGWL